MTELTINKQAIFYANGIHTNGNNKPVINLDTGDKYASATDAAEILGCSVHNVSVCCRGKTRVCKGFHLAYVAHASQNVDALAERIKALTTQQTELERKAALWDAQEAEKEAVRKAEEDLNNAIAKAEATVERRQRIYDRKMDDVKRSFVRLEEAKRELAALKAKRDDK